MRRNARSAGGAVLTAAAVFGLGVVLGASPAAADAVAPDGESPAIAHRQVAMQVGSTPVAMQAEFAVPAWLLPLAPEHLVALESPDGRPVLRLDATRVHARTQTSAVSDQLGVVEKVTKPAVTTLDTAAGSARSAPKAAPPAGVRPATVPDAAATPSRTPAAPAPLRVDASATALGGDYAWVPMQGISGATGGSSGVGAVGGLALLAVGAVAAGVTVVRRRTSATG